MTPTVVVVWTCVAILISTAVITLLALIGILKLGGGTAADHRYYLNRLFAALILEVVVNAGAIFYQETRTANLGALPKEFVNLEARVDNIEKRIEYQRPTGQRPTGQRPTGQRPTGRPSLLPRWELVRAGSDCTGQDIAATTGSAEPDKAKCSGPNITAVCWDGNLFRNGTGAWCTYKQVEPERCVGGGAPGRLFRCVRS